MEAELAIGWAAAASDCILKPNRKSLLGCIGPRSVCVKTSNESESEVASAAWRGDFLADLPAMTRQTCSFSAVIMSLV